MRFLLSRLLFASTCVAVTTFSGIVLELKEVMPFDMACKTLAISTALAIGASMCCRALDWMDAERLGVDQAGPPNQHEWEQ